VIQSGASLSGVDAVFNRRISAYIINDINRAKKGIAPDQPGVQDGITTSMALVFSFADLFGF
jgi:hypothetical protein